MRQIVRRDGRQQLAVVDGWVSEWMTNGAGALPLSLLNTVGIQSDD
jgi:hypothetical protein